MSAPERRYADAGADHDDRKRGVRRKPESFGTANEGVDEAAFVVRGDPIGADAVRLVTSVC